MSQANLECIVGLKKKNRKKKKKRKENGNQPTRVFRHASKREAEWDTGKIKLGNPGEKQSKTMKKEEEIKHKIGKEIIVGKAEKIKFGGKAIVTTLKRKKKKKTENKTQNRKKKEY